MCDKTSNVRLGLLHEAHVLLMLTNLIFSVSDLETILPMLYVFITLNVLSKCVICFE